MYSVRCFHDIKISSCQSCIESLWSSLWPSLILTQVNLGHGGNQDGTNCAILSHRSSAKSSPSLSPLFRHDQWSVRIPVTQTLCYPFLPALPQGTPAKSVMHATHHCYWKTSSPLTAIWNVSLGFSNTISRSNMYAHFLLGLGKNGSCVMGLFLFPLRTYPLFVSIPLSASGTWLAWAASVASFSLTCSQY